VFQNVGTLRFPTRFAKDTQINILHLHVVHANIDYIGCSVFFVTRTIFFWTLDVIDVRQRRIVFGILVDLVGLGFIFFVTRNTQIRQDDIGFFMSTVPAIIDQLSFLGHFHVIKILAFHTEVHSFYK